MKHTKKELSSYLLDELGGIDDRYVYEAQNYKSKRLSIPVKAVISIASAAAVLFLTVMTGIASLLFSTGKAAEATGLDDILQRDKGVYTSEITKEQLFSEKAFLVWQYEDKDGYYVADIENKSTLTKLKSGLIYGTPVNGTDIRVRLWICPGDGTACSPYLLYTPGNISYGALNDYNAEIIPTGQTVKIISAIINGKI